METEIHTFRAEGSAPDQCVCEAAVAPHHDIQLHVGIFATVSLDYYWLINEQICVLSGFALHPC